VKVPLSNYVDDGPKVKIIQPTAIATTTTTQQHIIVTKTVAKKPIE
jgi:hypothetical protein